MGPGGPLEARHGFQLVPHCPREKDMGLMGATRGQKQAWPGPGVCDLRPPHLWGKRRPHLTPKAHWSLSRCPPVVLALHPHPRAPLPPGWLVLWAVCLWLRPQVPADQGPTGTEDQGPQPPQTLSVPRLQRKLKEAARKILRLCLEKEQLLEMGNRLRAELGHQAPGEFGSSGLLRRVVGSRGPGALPEVLSSGLLLWRGQGRDLGGGSRTALLP